LKNVARGDTSPAGKSVPIESNIAVTAQHRVAADPLRILSPSVKTGFDGL
jgi:hypothetical protein